MSGVRQRAKSTGSILLPGKKCEDEVPLLGTKPLKRRNRISEFINKNDIKAWEVALVMIVLVGGFYTYYYTDHMHFHVTKLYAHAGYDIAQHKLGQYYLNGNGVEKHPQKAMEWFKLAADQGHPSASHNLAVGHIKGYHTLPKGEAHRLIRHAAANGIAAAENALNTVCSHGGCE